jgi:hypothetical protein
MVSVRLGRKRRAHQTGLAERRLGLIFFAPHGSSWHFCDITTRGSMSAFGQCGH